MPEITPVEALTFIPGGRLPKETAKCVEPMQLAGIPGVDGILGAIAVPIFSVRVKLL